MSVKSRLFGAVVVAFAGLVSPAIGMPIASAAPCSDVEVIFARGTFEPPGVGDTGQAFVDALRAKLGDKSVDVYPVNYPASLDFSTAAAGVIDASNRVRDVAATCPKTKMVLGGYSQGAAVIDVITTAPVKGLGFAAPMPAAVADHIAGVTVFGNPSARLGQPLTRMSQLYGAKTADMCNTADPICSLGNNFDSHVKYPESGLVKTAAKWVADNFLQTPAPQKDSAKADSAKKADRTKS
jgi:cutinase